MSAFSERDVFEGRRAGAPAATPPALRKDAGASRSPSPCDPKPPDKRAGSSAHGYEAVSEAGGESEPSGDAAVAEVPVRSTSYQRAANGGDYVYRICADASVFSRAWETSEEAGLEAASILETGCYGSVEIERLPREQVLDLEDAWDVNGFLERHKEAP